MQRQHRATAEHVVHCIAVTQIGYAKTARAAAIPLIHDSHVQRFLLNCMISTSSLAVGSMCQAVFVGMLEHGDALKLKS